MTLEPLAKSIKNALSKYNRTKDPASNNSINYVRELIKRQPVAVHPQLAIHVDHKEQALVDFKSQLSQFKPK